MATSYRNTSPAVRSASSRYLVVIRSTDIERGVFKIFCDNIAEARRALARNVGFWNSVEVPTVLDPLNGFSVKTLPAGVVKARSERYGRCLVASRSNGKGYSEWLEVISL